MTARILPEAFVLIRVAAKERIDPMAGILHQTTVARDGMHNGFPDLQFWQGAYWVSYRKGAGHTSMDARAVLSLSHDRSRFTEIASLRVKGDVRDPKLFPIHADRMAMYFPSWIEGSGQVERDGKRYCKPVQQFISFSHNGHDWEPPRPILDPMLWMWRIRKHAGRYYGLIQNLGAAFAADRSPHQLDLAVSDDLLQWETIARVGDGLNESDLVWRPDGEAWIVARTVKGRYSVFASARPPYTDWKTLDMAPMVHAPVMLSRGGELFVAGRSLPASEEIADAPFQGASLSVWKVGRGTLTPVLRIPAFGDCAYAGLIEDPEGRVCIAYYSQHAYTLGVLPRRMPTPGMEHPGGEADIFFAELELP